MAIYVDGSKLQIGAKSKSIVTIPNYISMKTFLFQWTTFKQVIFLLL